MRLDDFFNDSNDGDLEEKVEENIILKPFQVEAFNNWVKAGFKGVIIAPTGTGKTIIGGYAISRLKEPALIICPTERILKMWVERLREKFNIVATPYYGYVKKLSTTTVSIYNTVAMHHPELLDRFKLIILDEVHHAASNVFSRIIGLLNDGHKVMALTATLKREDEKHQLIKAKMPVVYCLDLKTAIQNGLVAPIKIIPVPVDMDDREREEYKKIEDSIARIKYLIAGLRDGEEKEKLESELRKKINIRKQLLSSLEEKKRAVYNIASRYDERVLVFSESVKSIEDLKSYLNRMGVASETYHSYKNEKERDRIFSEWGRSFKVLLSCRALDEGVDVPEASIAIMIASGMSVRQLVQRKGRIMRFKKGKTAELYVVYARGTVESTIPRKIESILKGIIKLY
ncbi:MAG: DEAD/DEAH box helicase [Ignisphaera sp.]